MLISTKGRYGLRIMTYLASHYDEGEFISLREIAEMQDLSQKYVERIMASLVGDNLLLAKKGKTGGYRLAKKPEEYTVGEILRVTEEDLVPVACMRQKAEKCTMRPTCTTFPMWREFSKLINDYFDSKTLTELMAMPKEE
ncbi:MAG: Rrf2 family transcriptional regulator [Lachnospiraceae bacterium]|nr:Rrf2 family transcriptional regulator [Lachnospiraceae bacterium]